MLGDTTLPDAGSLCFRPIGVRETVGRTSSFGTITSIGVMGGKVTIGPFPRRLRKPFSQLCLMTDSSIMLIWRTGWSVSHGKRFGLVGNWSSAGVQLVKSVFGLKNFEESLSSYASHS